jgi:hypothetical protein
MRFALAILVLLLILAMILSFVRNAVALKRDIDKRFDDFSARLADEARATVDPFLENERNDRAK